MRTNWLFQWLVGAAFGIVFCGVVSAQQLNCEQTAAMARMARAKSGAALAAEKRRAGDNYRVELVFAARLLQLRPTEQDSAVRLLNLIPKNDGQQTMWMTLGDSMCNGESLADMESLGRVRDALPRDLAKAVLLVPEKLPVYVAYALTSTQDPHNDYAVQMQTVCRAKHPEFVKSVGELPADKRDWFIKHVLNPEVCHALALPEAK